MSNSFIFDNNFNSHSNDQEIKSNCHNIWCGFCYKFLLGATGPTGPQGLQGIPGEIGPTGATWPSGGIINYADFYALMPPDNSATVAPGTDVIFPQDGVNSGASISRIGTNSFNLSKIGTYQIYFNVPVSEAEQLELTVNGVPLTYTVVGRATGTSDISGMFLIDTTTINSVLTVRNPALNAALTITTLAGGTNPV